MSCKATLDTDDQSPRCDFVTELDNHRTAHCLYPATIRQHIEPGGNLYYCDYHAGFMALTWYEREEHLKKWERGEA